MKLYVYWTENVLYLSPPTKLGGLKFKFLIKLFLNHLNPLNMSDFCYNKLELIGSTDDVNKAIDFIKINLIVDRDITWLNFKNILPMPKEILVLPDNDNSYIEWAYENWGCRWATLFEIESNIITYETNWSPSLGILKELSRLFPKVKFINCMGNESEREAFYTWEFLEGEEIKFMKETFPDVKKQWEK